MAGASRKNDPFHFDEIYKQAGVEDLFVKKTMAEQKQKPSPGTVPSASPVRPAVATPAPRPATNPASFDLDFLASIATPGGTPPGMSKQNSFASLTVAGLAHPQPQPPVQTPPPAALPPQRKPSDDPFALFEEVPGAAPPQRHAPPPAPATRPSAGAGGLLLDFDDGHAFSSAPAAPSQPSISLLSPTTGARAPEPPAQPAVLQAAVAPLPSHPPPPPDYSDHAAHRPAPPGPAATTTRPLAAATAGASAAPPASPSRAPPAFPDGHAAAGLRNHDPGSFQASGSREFPSAAGSVTSASSVTAGADYPQHLPQSPYPQQHPHQHTPQQHQQGYYDLSDVPESSQPSNSSAPSFTWGHTPSGSGLSGYLKAFGKKAVRAAKAGLATLEHALEGLDSPQHHPGQHQQALQQRYQGQGAGAQHAPPSVAPGRVRSDVATEGADVSNDEALAWAVRLADLSPHAQQQELAHMAPPLRRKVIEVLREQVRSEHEAAAAAAAVAGAVAPGGGSGGELGHGASELSRAQAPPPPPYGHGTPLLPRQPSSQDGAAPCQQPPGVPRERSGDAAAATTPPGYNDAAQHPVAVSRPAQPPQEPASAVDLLGLGSDELHLRPAAAAGSAAAAPAAAPSAPAHAVTAAPIVDDLLGFGDDAPRARAAAGASAAPVPPPASKPSGPAAAAAAPPPPPSPQQTAVHVDDMDDFFSGGKTAPVTGGSGRSDGLNMHGSSSAPNLGATRPGGGATAVSSSTAALADMLHGSDDEGGGGGNVDVSGYADLYRGEQGSADEPELRRRLRAQREAAKHAKMKAALAEKLAMEAEEAARREQQVVLKDQHKADIEVWKNKNKGNIRGLLGSLHTVLWPDSGWAPVSVGDLLEPIQVKKVYMRANLLVHPDKVRQRNGSADQVAIADMVFDVLKDAWNAFR